MPQEKKIGFMKLIFLVNLLDFFSKISFSINIIKKPK